MKIVTYLLDEYTPLTTRQLVSDNGPVLIPQRFEANPHTAKQAKVADDLRPESASPVRSMLFVYWAWFILISLLLCLPILSTEYPPLVDYPTHLARAYILYCYHQVPIYQKDYVETHEIVPNLAIDLIVPSLLQFMNLGAASKCFLVLVILLFAVGCHLLGRAVRGHPSRLAMLCTFFVYCSMFLYGFVNYVFGLGMFCVTLSCWLRWRSDWSVVRVLLIAALAFCTYLSHLTAYFLLGVSIVVIGFVDHRSGKQSLRSFIISLLLLVPELLVYVPYMHGALHHPFYWGTLKQKVTHALPFVLTYNYHFDLFFLTAIAALGVFVFWHVERLQVNRSVFAAGVVFAALFAGGPNYAMGGGGADARMVPAAILLPLLSVDAKLPRSVAHTAFLVCLLLFGLRLGEIWRTWRALDPQIGSQVQAFSALPEGARIYPAFIPPDGGRPSKTNRVFGHVLSYATIFKHAYVPHDLSIPGQESLLFRNPPSYRAPTSLGPSQQWVDSMKRYDYVWSYATPDSVDRVLEANCDRLVSSGGATIWRVRK